MLFYTLTIQSIREPVKGFKVFEFAPGHGIEYRAGQYLTLVQNKGKDEIRRSYSIISSPFLDEPLAIGIKRIQNGAFSRELIDHAKEGDQVITTGAAGFFTLPPQPELYDQMFFLAAGSGITPVLSLLKTVLYVHPRLKTTLVYSSSAKEATAFLPQLEDLHLAFPDRFRPHFLFSNSVELHKARLHRDLLLELLQAEVGAKEATLFYLCGPEAYMRMITYVLQEQQIKGEQIRRENFIIANKNIPRALPPDIGARRVQIQYGNDRYDVLVNYPDSILQAAKNQNIELPYSCETGRCGSCAARVLSGAVWLSYNEVLTEKDLQNGLTLTCVGHPVGEGVELAF